MDDLVDLDLSQLAPLIKNRAVSPVEVVKKTLARIEELNESLKAYVTVTGDQALRDAQIAEEEIQAGHYRSAVHGVPIAIKDAINTRGVRTTNGSRIFANHIPDHDAHVVSKLKDHGAIIVGKSNMHEFAMGSTTANEIFGRCRNPWNLEHVPGGSSGGSAVAVAAGLCFGAVATDSAGSVRSPAAQCGIVGFKPTFGLVGRSGVFPVSHTLDHIGPMARTVGDCAVIFESIVSHDPCDPDSVTTMPADCIVRLGERRRDFRIGVPFHYFFDGVEPIIEKLVLRAIAVLEDVGMSVVPMSWPSALAAANVTAKILAFEAAQTHRHRLAERPDDYSPDVRARLHEGLSITPEDYRAAAMQRARLRAEFHGAMSEVDVMVSPTNPASAPLHGAQNVQLGDELAPLGAVMPRYCMTQNLTGCPALSLPCGFADSGVPVGIQFVARSFEDGTLLNVAHRYERAAGWRGMMHPTMISTFPRRQPELSPQR